MTSKNIWDQYRDKYTITLWGIENNKYFIIQKIGKGVNKVHMLLVKEIVDVPKKNYAGDHVVLIKDPFTLFGSFKVNNYDVKVICHNCARFYISKEKLDIHYKECLQENVINRHYAVPKEAKQIFRSYKKQEMHRFLISFDLKLILSEVKILANTNQYRWV